MEGNTIMISVKTLPNILYLDFETSGLDPERHAILQAAWILEKNGEVIQERVYDVKPESNDDMCLAALEVNGFDFNRIKAGTSLNVMIAALKRDCLQVELPRICGHNVQFDIGFLHKASNKVSEYIRAYLDTRTFLDTAAIARYYDYKGLLSLDRYNLEECCRHFGIVNDKAHDALGDIRATRRLFHILADFKVNIS